MTLRQAVDLALQQNPEVMVTRLDEQRAAQSVRLARDPFFPKLVIGSGAAYSSGYPLTIDGSPPSIFQGRAVQTFYNRTKTYQVAEARETSEPRSSTSISSATMSSFAPPPSTWTPSAPRR